ncbi:hypothetical protein [Nocardioides pinisoli]|nr:hypothetical protein [Nocardioides pinisoli]
MRTMDRSKGSQRPLTSTSQTSRRRWALLARRIGTDQEMQT